jgi:hypothetical protein
MEDLNANPATSPSPITNRPSLTARRSGGQRTAEGKRRSCQNGRRHGLYTDERFLECAALERSSADPRFRGPRFFRGATDEPRTPTPGVRATSIGAVLAAFKKIKNRGNELKDLLQRQGITEIADSKRTHFRAEKAAIGVERSGISRIVTARRPPAKAVLRDRCRNLARRSADLQVSSSEDSRPTCPPEGRRYTNPGNKARMSMKTNSQGVEGLRSRGVAGPIREVASDADGSSLLNPRLSASRLEFDGTKRECL